MHTEPEVEVFEATQHAGTTRLLIYFDQMPSEPVAPAGLYAEPGSAHPAFELHKLVGRDRLLLSFETYDCPLRVPAPGKVFHYRAWWLPEAMAAARDTVVSWKLTTYPDNGDHDHCLFTWATIAAHTEHRRAYHSKHGWITVEAYEKFIRDDVYRVRE